LLNLEKKVSLYIVALLMFVSIIGSVLFGASVRHVLIGGHKLGFFGETVLYIAEFPVQVRTIFSGNPSKIKDSRFRNLDGFKKDDKLPAGVFSDDGYLLLSSYNADKEQATVQLIQINTQKTLHEWAPDLEHLNELSMDSTDYVAKSNFRLLNPLPINSRLIFNNFGGLYGMNLCGENDMFADGSFHHSNELDHEGNIWVPSVAYPNSLEKKVGPFTNDSIAKISPSGEVLFNKSVAEILVENSYRGLLAASDDIDKDPIHLNEIQPVLTDSEFWRKGDLFLSLANLNTILLYRPLSNKILWLKTGPWMLQHDINFVDNHTISVFGNDLMYRKLFDGHNSVYFYDFKTDKVTEPYQKIMKEIKVKTLSEGRGTPLSGGDLFIEESNNGRILRVSTDEVKWEYVSRIDEDTIAMSSWSRYLTQQEANPILAKLKGISCK